MKAIFVAVLLSIASTGAIAEVSCWQKSRMFYYLSLWAHRGLGQDDALRNFARDEEFRGKMSSETIEQVVSEFYADPAILKLTNEEVEQQTNAICKGSQARYLPPNPEIAARHKKAAYCDAKSRIYTQTAEQRDLRGTPQGSWEFFIKAEYWKNVPKKEIKSIINQVYFDPAFERAGGNALFNQMLDVCLNGPRKLTPLK
jgi:hypothetical protein